MSELGPLPPLSTLRIFEAAARRESFQMAAAELNLTASAVSKQIRQLEDQLGQPLFERLHREVRLTAAGRRYAEAVLQVFRDLAAATDEVRRERPRDALVLWCATWFLRAWLLPRLERFRERHPNVALTLHTGNNGDAIAPTVDISVRVGDGKWPRTQAQMLMPQEVTAVCSPAYMAQHRIAEPYRFSDFVVLDSANTPHHLEMWKMAVGLAGQAPRETLVFQSNETAFAAAQSDHGIALANPRFVAEQLALGTLVQPWPVTALTGRAYWLCWHDRYDLPPAARAFRSWILKESRRPALNG